MTTRGRLATPRLIAFLVVLLVPVLGVQQPAGAAGARCTSGKDVTVVVDYGRLRSGIDFFCARGAGGMTGFEIMRRAGISAETVRGQPFVCRIQGYPKDQTCASTPPPDAYWGLFWSDGSPQTWSYSSRGAASLRVPGGGSLGWRFQDGGDPVRPAAAPTAPTKARPTPSPKPSPKPSPRPAPSPAAKPSDSPRPSPSVRPTTAPSKIAAQTPQGTPASASAKAAATPRKSAGSGPSSAEQEKAGKGRGAKTRSEEKRRSGDDRKDRDGRDDDGAVTSSADEEYEANEPLAQPVVQTSASDDGGSATTVAALVLLVGLGAAAALVARRRRAS